jgi:hypothetical protein
MSVFDLLPQGINEAEEEFQEQPQGRNAVNEIEQIQRQLLQLKNTL